MTHPFYDLAEEHYISLNSDQELIGVYGYFYENSEITQLGFIIKERVDDWTLQILYHILTQLKINFPLN